MKNSKFAYFTIAAVFLFVACGSNDTANAIHVIDIEAGVNNAQEIKLSKYCTDIEYIPIVTNDDFLLSDALINQQATENGIIIADFHQSHQCFLINYKGEYVSKVGSVGRAKGEYTNVSNIMYKSCSDEIVVNSYNSGRLLFYDNNGAFKKEVNLDGIGMDYDARADNITILGNDYLVVCGYMFHSKKPVSMITDYQGKIIRIDSTYVDDTRMALARTVNRIEALNTTTCRTFSWDNVVSIVNPFTDTIYSYTENADRVARYLFDYGKYKVKDDMSNKDNSLIINSRLTRESEHFIIFWLLANDNKFDFMHNHVRARTIHMLYDKATGETIAIPHSNKFGKDSERGKYILTNDIDNGIPIAADNFRVYKNKMYQIISAEQFIEWSKITDSPKAKEIAAGLTYDSNPVMVVATLK